MDGRNNEIQNLSLQQENLIDQLSNANKKFMSLRFENERMRNDLNYESKINERMRNNLSKDLKRTKNLLLVTVVR